MHKKSPSLPASIISSLRQRRSRPTAASAHGSGRSSGTLVASYNVHKCVGVDGRFDPERIARVIAEIGADVIALQEADKRFGERHGLLDLAWLEQETGLVPVPLGNATRAHGWHGNVVLFRQGLVRDVHQVSLPGLEPRGALVVDIDLESGAALRIVAAHLGLDRAEVRSRNFIQPDEMPYDHGLMFQDGRPLKYDSGDFPASLAKLKALVGWDD